MIIKKHLESLHHKLFEKPCEFYKLFLNLVMYNHLKYVTLLALSMKAFYPSFMAVQRLVEKR